MTLYERDQRNIEKGRKEGRAEGEAVTLFKIITGALKRGVSIPEIAVIVDMSENEIRKFCCENNIDLKE